MCLYCQKSHSYINHVVIFIDLPPTYCNNDQKPPSYEDVYPSSGDSNAAPPSYADTLPPDHISPLPSVPTNTSVQIGSPLETQNSQNLRTQEESDQVKY